MNPSALAKTAYNDAAAPVLNHRRTEYQAFARVTHMLNLAGQDFPALAEAIHLNRRLWTLLASDVADTDNFLPEELRARIFYLAEFTDQHSRKVLNREAEVDILIEINRAILRGLGDPLGVQS